MRKVLIVQRDEKDVSLLRKYLDEMEQTEGYERVLAFMESIESYMLHKPQPKGLP